MKLLLYGNVFSERSVVNFFLLPLIKCYLNIGVLKNAEFLIKNEVVMSKKIYIAAFSMVVTKSVERIAVGKNLLVYNMKSRDNIYEELQEITPDIIFIQASIVEDASENIITRIKEDDKLGKAYIVILAMRTHGLEFAYHYGADNFLPIPVVEEQFNFLMRNALDLPRMIFIISKSITEEHKLYKELESFEFQLILSTNGREGLIKAQQIYPDMIIVDQTLDDMTGQNFCTMIKMSKMLFHIPVMILSDEQNVNTIENCFDAGANDILLPPFESQINLDKITSIVSPPNRGRKEKALIVDDSILMRNIISKMFTQLGFITITAPNGEEGIKSALLEKPDIVTSDYDMPVMDGWQFVSAMKKDDKTKDIPIIMVTSRSSEVDKKKGRLLGVNAYLTKPFFTEKLEDTIKEVMGEAKKERESSEIKKYISTDALESVKEHIKEGRNMTSKDKFISILFTDICNFSSKCEKLSAENIVVLLNNFFEQMVDVLIKNNAIVDKFIGDAIVARFDSNDREQDALNAIKAASAMIGRIEEDNRDREEKILIRVGINSGFAILGNIGCKKHRLDYTMIGDNVNIAQRLETNAPSQGCLISESTYNLTRAYCEVGEEKSLKVKGKTEVVRAYPLLGVHD